MQVQTSTQRITTDVRLCTVLAVQEHFDVVKMLVRAGAVVCDK